MVKADGVPQFELPVDLDLVEPAEDAWDRYWFDPVSKILNESDYVLVYRWITNLNRYFKLIAEADAEPIVTGAQGQDAMNPKYTAANNALTAAERIERQLGMGPSNRSKLGIELIQADGAMAEHELKRGADPARVTVERADPRELG